MVRESGRAVRLSIFVDDDDVWHHKPLYHEIVRRAHTAGLVGASVFHGVEGFGATATIHTPHLFTLAEDLPIEIIIVDTEDKIRAFLPQLDGLVTEGLMTISPVEVLWYRPEARRQSR